MSLNPTDEQTFMLNINEPTMDQVKNVYPVCIIIYEKLSQITYYIQHLQNLNDSAGTGKCQNHHKGRLHSTKSSTCANYNHIIHMMDI
jgi:hypothetical protein